MLVKGKAFILRPDTPKEGKPRQPRPGEAPGQLSEPLRSSAEEAGLIMRPPSLTPNTMYALEATTYASEQGKFDVFHRGLYVAYWEHGKDLGSLEVIEQVAGECGLEWPELRDRLESSFYQEQVIREFQEASDLGINGIPAFLIGNFLFTGARPYEVFKAVMARVQGGNMPAGR